MRYEFSNEITNGRTLFMGFAILLVLFFGTIKYFV